MSEVAIFGAGCFWGVEELFRTMEGVLTTEVGYCGGKTEQTDYKEVCTGTTDHAEVVKITFDPTVITFETLLDKFWCSHNPTTLNRQGPDVGTQYRSVVFFTTPGQQEKARKALAELEESNRFDLPIVTQIMPEKNYVPAEEYHQKYLFKRGKSSCQL